jgi:hypothetical protein
MSLNSRNQGFFLLADRRFREAQKYVDPDPVDPEHIVLRNSRSQKMT